MGFIRETSSVSWPPQPANYRIPLTRGSVGFPDPFAVATINGEQTQTTGVIKKTLNPYWNENFDLYADQYESYGGSVLSWV